MKLSDIIKEIEEGKALANTVYMSNDSDGDILLYDDKVLKRKRSDGFDDTFVEDIYISRIIYKTFRKIEPVIEDKVLYYNKTIEIKNHIGIFDDEYIDKVSITYDNNKTYEVIPIEDKISIPYIKDGKVFACYKKLVKGCISYNLKWD